MTHCKSHWKLNMVSFAHFLFTYFWLHQVFVATYGLSLVAVSRGLLFSRSAQASHLTWFLLLRSTGSRERGLSSCDSQT